MCIFFRRKKTNKNIKLLEVVKNEIIELSTEECSICLEYLNTGSCVVMRGCNHFFHHACIQKYIKSKMVQSNKRVHCPYCDTFQYNLQ